MCLHELGIFKIYKEEGISGTIPLNEREQGKKLIEDAKNKEFDTLLVYKLDRLGRSARITLNSIYDLEGYGLKIKSMTEPFDTSNPSGRFMITILAGVADLERETILERMWHGANRSARRRTMAWWNSTLWLLCE
ncbi:recombinase family protein [Clostridium sp.]|uniref:recombinase family protein n=1 Tax=Clostridium sp. TaxID=1506 RepID=UPI00258EC8E0|nr:recombinase family protein [Clostridium sp.]MDF2505101.1 site-specific recombinase, invertase Pin [Clostridium sp.]